MDYKKAYEDALERAKGIYNENPSSSTAKFVCGQIFPEIKESEDERIRKSLLKLVSNDKNNGYTVFYNAEGITCDDAIAYLEKQKEQKPVKCIDFDNEFENQVSHLIASVLNGEHEYSEGFVKYAVQSLLGYAQNELKSAEWSKEDERMLSRCIKSIECSKMFAETKTFKEAKDKEIDWLKSLRPAWKPSEEQMDALKEASTSWMNEHIGNCELLESLYNDLTKL